MYLSEACGLGRSERLKEVRHVNLFFFSWILSFRYPPCHGIPRGPLFPFSSLVLCSDLMMMRMIISASSSIGTIVKGHPSITVWYVLHVFFNFPLPFVISN